MRILFVAPGAHENQQPWLKALRDQGHKVLFWVWGDMKPHEPRVVEPSVIQPSLFSRVLRRLVWKAGNAGFKRDCQFGVPAIVPFIRNFVSFSPDVVLARQPLSYPFSFIAIAIARVRGAQVVMYNQTPLHKPMPWLNKQAMRVFVWLFNAEWITPVKGNESRWPKFHSRAHYVPFSVELPETQAAPGGHSGSIHIITVGKLDQERKNILMLVRAIHELSGCLDLRLTVVGHLLQGEDSPVYQRILAYIKENDLESIVTVKKNLGHSEVRAEYRKHDLFVLPSSNEPAAVSLLEAMAAGLPVITSDTNGTRCYIKEGKNGCIFRDSDPKDLVASILSVVDDPVRMAEMGRRSREEVMAYHSPQQFHDTLMAIIERSS